MAVSARSQHTTMVAGSFNCNSHMDSMASRDMSEDPSELSLVDVRFIVVGRKLKSDNEFIAALKQYDCPYEFCDSAMEYVTDEPDFDTIFIVEAFEGTAYHSLHRSGARIIAKPALMRCIPGPDRERLPNNTRPLYNPIMRDVVICFTGFKRKEQLSLLAELVHHMGGSIRREFGPRVSHLVANCTGGEKYRAAVSRGRPIMSEEWVHQAWEMREDISMHATDERLSKYKLDPFSYTCLSFYGFPNEEKKHMEDITIQNGGTYAAAGAPTCTHLVVDEHSVKSIPFEIPYRLYVVKSEWFWASIQMDACADEAMYFYKEDKHENAETPGSTKSTTPHTLSGGKNRKRKRLKENLAQLANVPEVDSPMVPHKRKSTEAALLSMSASLLDVTTDNSGFQENNDVASSPVITQAAKPSGRWQVAMELLQTETNYVEILGTIVGPIKNDLENTAQPGGAILPATEVKLIFSKLPPIHEIHMKIRKELATYLSAWKEEHSVGSVILKHADSLLRAYPPFVNFYTNTKETILECEKKYPRFHAFLKVCQNRPECGRQTLPELFIRPVQRLPSVILLLKDMLRKTPESNPDHGQLELALERLENVLKHINEDKRKTEGQLAMMNIFNDIANCPPNLLSSHRNFVISVDALDVRNTLSRKGDIITLFLFSDSLELCKQKVKLSRSPAVHTKTPQKAYKHLEVLQLSSIKRVVDVTDQAGLRNVFALIVKHMDDKEERLFAFQLVDEGINKEEFLKTLSKHISSFVCGADYAKLMTTVDASMLHIKPSVNRSISFKATKLKRAMSSVTQMMSPFRRESENASHSPPSGLSGTRLASAANLSESTVSLCDIVDQNATPRMRRRPSVFSMFKGKKH